MSSEATFDPATDPDAAAPAASIVVALADNKYFLAHRLASWGVGAPVLESAVAGTAIAQEEAGHARGLYALLDDFPDGTAPLQLEREDDRERKYALTYLLEPGDSWIRGVASLVLMDRAMNVVLEATRESSFGELRKRAVRILGDESFHQRFADGRVREIAGEPREKAALEEQLAALLPETLCWFGPVGEPGMELLVSRGIVSKNNEELRQAFLDGLGSLAAETGIRLPIERGEDGVWTYPELPWANWDKIDRRLTKQPSIAV